MKRTGILLVALFCAATSVMAQTKGSRPEPQPASKAEWQTALSRKIQRTVRMPRPIAGVSGPHTASVAFVAHRDGTISDVEIRESSGVAQVDAHAREAILRMSPVAPFSPDMTGDREKIVAPIRMELVLPNPTTRDAATGLTFTTPGELEAIGRADAPGAETVKYAIASTVPDRIPGTPDKTVCEVGFRQWTKDNPRYGWSQEKLNEAAMFEVLDKSARSEPEQGGRVVEDSQTIDMSGAKAVEMMLAPAAGAAGENQSHYKAFADTPTGRITVSCVTPHAVMATARPVFKALAQTVQVVR